MAEQNDLDYGEDQDSRGAVEDSGTRDVSGGLESVESSGERERGGQAIGRTTGLAARMA